MPAAPLPSNERARLKALNDLAILDTLPEEPFDALVQVAQSVAQVPIALISLVDAERQWFKARRGVDACETPRDAAFCAYAIHSSSVLWVEDAAADDRFADNPLVTGEPGIRFYAGAPLTLRTGHRLGTLCVIDTKPRGYDPRLAATLEQLALAVVHAMEARLSLQQVAQTQAALSLTKQQDDVVTAILDAALGANDPKSFSQTCLDILIERTPWLSLIPQGAVFLTDPHGINHDLYLVANHKLEAPLKTLCAKVKEGHCLCGRAAATGTLIHATCVDHRHETRFDGMAPHGHYAVPLPAGESRLGVLTLYLPEGHQRCAEEEAFLQRVASAMALGLERLQRLDEMESFFSLSLDLMGIASADGRFLRLNQAWEETLGYKMEDLLHRNYLELVHPEDQDATRDAMADLAKGAAVQGFCNRYQTVDGRWRWLEWQTAPGKEGLVFFAAKDVTDQRAAALALTQTTERLNDVVALTGTGVWEVDLLTGEVFWDKQTRNIHDVDETYVPSMEKALGFYPQSSLDVLEPAIAHSMRTGDPWELELPFVTATGRNIWVKALGRAILQDGQPVKLRGSFQDSTAVRTALDRARLAEQRLRAAIEALPDGFVLFDRDDRLVVFNEPYKHLYSASAPAIFEGATFESILRYGAERGQYPEAVGREAEWLAQRMAHHHEAAQEMEQELPGNRWVRIIERETPDGDRVGFRVDITNLKRQQQALSRARLEAEKASIAKSQFLANMSHEIRTPMTGLIGMLDIMLDNDLPDDHRQRALQARTSANALLAILNDILDVSKLEAGDLKIERIPVSVRAILEDCLGLAAPRAKEKALRLQSFVDPSVPKWILSDPTRLRQIMLNLVTNAVKFTEVGHVTITLGRRFHQDQETLCIEVQDSGIGIPAAAQARLFDRFTQAEESTTRRFGGTGLGLAICKQLIDLMQGEISVESGEGKGTTFSVRLPLEETAAICAPAPVSHAIPTDSGSQTPLRVLLAEDVMVNRMVIQSLLGKRGHEVTVATNGLEAVEAVTQERFDVILMDIQMPEMDGYEATQAIRALPEPACDTPIVALTAHAMEGDREMCIRHGMDDYATKPIDVEQLVGAIERATSMTQEERVKRRSGESPCAPLDLLQDVATAEDPSAVEFF